LADTLTPQVEIVWWSLPVSDVVCIECHAAIQVREGVIVGEIVQCRECGVELEVVGVEPIRLELAPEVEEDWGE
jgi:alpha-aminoadipate carrier protein LysW